MVIDENLPMAEAARDLRIKVRTAYRWAQGENPRLRTVMVGGEMRVPRAELDRLRAARENAEVRALVAGTAAGFLDQEARRQYRVAVGSMAKAARALAEHHDGSVEHRADLCATCVAILDQLVPASETARTAAAVLPLAANVYQLVRAAAADADRTSAALRSDEETHVDA